MTIYSVLFLSLSSLSLSRSLATLSTDITRSSGENEHQKKQENKKKDKKLFDFITSTAVDVAETVNRITSNRSANFISRLLSLLLLF